MDSVKTIVVIGKSRAMDILSSIKDRLPHKRYNKMFGIVKIDRFLDFSDDLNFPYVTLNGKNYALNLSIAKNGIINLSTDTAAFIVAFSVVDFESSFAIGRKWIPAMKLYFPNIPITENTNRNSLNLTNSTQLLKNSDIENIITTEMGELLVREIKATKYFEVCNSDKGDSTIFEEAIGASFKNRKILRSCKIAVVGSPDSGKTEIIRQFVFGKRLSVLDEHMNEPLYLYDTDDTIFATSIEIDGEVFDLRIQAKCLICVFRTSH